MTEKAPSEIIQDFIDYLREAQEIYSNNQALVHAEDGKLQDFVHAIEFEGNSKVRSKICTQMHESRMVRCECKNRVELYDGIVKFTHKEQTKLFLRTLRQLVEAQRMTEQRLAGEREYKPRSYVYDTLPSSTAKEGMEQ